MNNLSKKFDDSSTIASSFCSGEVLLVATDPNNPTDDELIELLVRLSQTNKQYLEIVSPEGSFTVECVNCFDEHSVGKT